MAGKATAEVAPEEMAGAQTLEVTEQAAEHEAAQGAEMSEAIASMPSTGQRMTAADVNALVSRIDEPLEFDPQGIYVVAMGVITIPRGPLGQWREGAYEGDLVAAQDDLENGVRGVCHPEMKDPKTGLVIQEATDGTAELERAFRKGAIVHPQTAAAIAKRRARMQADATIPGGRKYI